MFTYQTFFCHEQYISLIFYLVISTYHPWTDKYVAREAVVSGGLVGYTNK